VEFPRLVGCAVEDEGGGRDGGMIFARQWFWAAQ
jgi:hypothetical protein